MEKPLSTEIIDLVNQNKAQIYKFMGYGVRRMPDIIEHKLEDELKGIKELIKPYYHYKILDIDEEERFWSYKVFKQLKPKTKKLALIVYTVGSKIEEKIEYYSNNQEMIRGLALDKIAVVALDSLRELIIDEIKTKTGLKRIYEIYPTNKDFSIEGQELIYRQLCDKDKDLENITINKHYQLYPIKSVAMAVILGDKEEEFNRCRECKACERED